MKAIQEKGVLPEIALDAQSSVPKTDYSWNVFCAFLYFKLRTLFLHNKLQENQETGVLLLGANIHINLSVHLRVSEDRGYRGDEIHSYW